MKGNKINYKRYLLLGGAITVVILLLIITNIYLTLSKNNITNSKETTQDTSTIVNRDSKTQKDSKETDTEIDSTTLGEDSTKEIERTLDENTKKELENLAENYYLTLAKSKSDEKREGIEAYTNITSYIKSGLANETYVIFSSYDMKFENIKTLAPGMSVIYAGKASDGKYAVKKDANSEEQNDYINLLLKEEDMKTVTNEVNTNLEKAMKDDKVLKEFIQKVEKAE
ncbi:hypothetical protein [Anaeromicropila herbilytica]|uniref:Uncharacterized protein n=1 Tax=Anaeromicropila herbilytica TaxID=2785025 RepID=A0A7R7IDD3_9FIRM|nr:hypothetical protein [Anaeromicropila herbilytica]BCN30934.1 hypothetical protein bsdtb5_22290 [Anaeromicropila herbilytica]